MLPVRLRPCGLLSGVHSVAALTWIAALLLSPSVSRAHERPDHDGSARAARASSIHPRVTAQSELYEVVGILEGDRLIGAIILAQAVNVCTRSLVGVAASFEHVA